MLILLFLNTRRKVMDLKAYMLVKGVDYGVVLFCYVVCPAVCVALCGAALYA